MGEETDMIYLLLFWEFFQTGLFAVGGGLATLPFLYSISDRYGWFTHAQIADMLAVSESTPGPIGVNMATYCGMTVAGVPGALVATLGLVLPSILIILLVASLLTRFRENRFVESVLRVLRPVSVGMVAAAVWSVIKAGLFVGEWTISWIALAVFGVVLVLALKFQKLHPIVLMILGAAAGIVLHMGGL